MKITKKYDEKELIVLIECCIDTGMSKYLDK